MFSGMLTPRNKTPIKQNKMHLGPYKVIRALRISSHIRARLLRITTLKCESYGVILSMGSLPQIQLIEQKDKWLHL
jgi:hypothetical protein